MSAPMFVPHLQAPLVIPDLVGHWKLDEGTGTTANDSSATNADGTITNGSWVAGPGPSGNALSLNGTTAYVDFGDFAAWEFGTAPFSACGWIKDGGGINGRIFGQQQLSANPGWMWILGSASIAYNFIARVQLSTTTVYALDSNWHHITTVRNGTSYKLYLDTMLIQDLTILVGDSASGSSNLRLGAGSSDGTTIVNYTSATAYDLRLYGHALYQAEVDAIYAGNVAE